ncbi:nucleosidase [Rhodococcus sp. SRB_17]|uniref:nucleosidase n=1 Tax=Rhodococcus sp. OK302 TaxID=1882769 RepID=UPI000B940E8A|nr:nucleosidase [Rhodococcus sp. OK302]NMM84340.1 nucleosidase [Rhodococcus sp. SRB_17]OYD69298.1 purine nucleosidase/adenosylhomocysteine nucleosidase [Rhodococcus sp. OK302]
MSAQQVLVVSATVAEAAYVPQEFELVITGIGKVSAATAVASALARFSSDALPLVVNIGTAGALHTHHGGLFVPGVVINHDISSAAIRSFGHEVADRLELLGGDDSVLATGDAFISDAAVRDALAERADLVDMEGFAVAYAATAAGARCRLVKHVSDQADDSAMDWPAQIDASARELGRWLIDNV